MGGCDKSVGEGEERGHARVSLHAQVCCVLVSCALLICMLMCTNVHTRVYIHYICMLVCAYVCVHVCFCMNVFARVYIVCFVCVHSTCVCAMFTAWCVHEHMCVRVCYVH